MPSYRTYSGNQLNEIRMPLGGIGAGCVHLNGAGRLVDWEISGYANKNSSNGYTHFAIKAEDDQGNVWARALHGDEPGGRMGSPTGQKYACYGFGQSRETLGGLPHFPQANFQAAWPAARMNYAYSGFPGQVELDAFSSFIPQDSANSSLPAAFFEWEVTNTTGQPLSYTLCFSVTNPFQSVEESCDATNRYYVIDGLHSIMLENLDYSLESRKIGALAFSVQGEGDVSYQEYWFRGAWFDSLQVYWKDLTARGPLHNRRYDNANSKGTDTASLAITKQVEPGETWKVRFLLNWYFPFMENDWNPMSRVEQDCSCGDCGCDGKQDKTLSNRWRKWSGVQFADIFSVIKHCVKNYDALRRGTFRFIDAMMNSTLPAPVLDAALSTLASLVTPLCLRLSDGSFYGWEGLHETAGCCEGSCTHVWNYAYALCYLFPDLERSMRDLDFLNNMDEHGGMRFRLQLPPGRKHSAFMPCTDGQFGGIIKLWRDYIICGDRQWLEGHWPRVKKMLSYAWNPANECAWDPEKTGVLTGRQHHTLDNELFGPNSWLTGMYLAALKAATLMAELFGDQKAATEYSEIFEHGRKWVNEHLFNGDYYFHKIDFHDKNILRPYKEGTLVGSSAEQAYWDVEHGEIKYQIGEGCAIDQVLGQWHANLCGLGDILAPGQVTSALRAIYRYNYKPTMRDFFNPCRLYCVNDESGTLICSYPEGHEKPAIPVPYAEETMHGFEYQAACHMLQQGLEEEGIDLVKAVRDRYDGVYRNPFNEVECGSNYARSMAVFAFLPSYSGLRVDMGRGYLRFNPIIQGGFRCFFSVGQGWGEFEHDDEETVIRVECGHILLRELDLPYIISSASITLDGKKVDATLNDGVFLFADNILLTEGSELRIVTKS